jgi:hypothetical protein
MCASVFAKPAKPRALLVALLLVSNAALQHTPPLPVVKYHRGLQKALGLSWPYCVQQRMLHV